MSYKLVLYKFTENNNLENLLSYCLFQSSNWMTIVAVSSVIMNHMWKFVRKEEAMLNVIFINIQKDNPTIFY